MKLVPYTPSVKTEMPKGIDLWKIPKEWFNKPIVVSAEESNNCIAFHTIIFRWYEMGWDGWMPEIVKFNFTRYVGSSEGLYVLID